MIRLTMEIVPRGDESKKFTAGTLEIANDCTGTEELGNYHVKITGPVHNGDGRAAPDEFWGKFRLEGFHRPRGWWSCVKEALLKFDTDYTKEDAS